MQVFTAARPVRPEPDDIFEALEGELVFMLGCVCSCPDCDAHRSMTGLASGRVTTTFTVTELPHLGVAALRDALRDALLRFGWPEGDELDDAVRDLTDQHVEMAAEWPTGGLFRIALDQPFP